MPAANARSTLMVTASRIQQWQQDAKTCTPQQLALCVPGHQPCTNSRQDWVLDCQQWQVAAALQMRSNGIVPDGYLDYADY